MKVLICRDDGQLRRIESAIAAIEAASSGERQSKLALLNALEIEHASLLQYAQRGRSTARTHPPKNRPRQLSWLDASQHEYAVGA